jgi:hypothetical protein
MLRTPFLDVYTTVFISLRGYVAKVGGVSMVRFSLLENTSHKYDGMPAE